MKWTKAIKSDESMFFDAEDIASQIDDACSDIQISMNYIQEVVNREAPNLNNMYEESATRILNKLLDVVRDVESFEGRIDNR